MVILGSFSTTRLAEEETQASFLATQGLEAVQSMRNQDWQNIIPGLYGLDQSSGFWIFSGTSDVDDSGKFTRSILIEEVQRDGNQDIVQTGGTIDDETYRITSRVVWNFTPSRQNTVEMSQYITNWQLVRGQGQGGGGQVNSCTEYCQSLSYTTGTCRKNVGACNQNGETYESGGGTYCTGGNNVDTCCCL